MAQTLRTGKATRKGVSIQSAEVFALPISPTQSKIVADSLVAYM
jgi:hypothetical protein